MKNLWKNLKTIWINQRGIYNPNAWEERDVDLDIFYETLGWSKNRLNIIDMILNCDPKKILDIGCLDGDCIRKLRELGYKNEYVGIDITKSHIKKAQAKTEPEEDFRVGDARDIMFDNNSFDTVVISDVIQHLPNPRTPLEEACRVSNKWVVISVYGSKKETYTHHSGGHLNTRYSKKDFLSFIPEAWSVETFEILKHPMPLGKPPSDLILFHLKILKD